MSASTTRDSAARIREAIPGLDSVARALADSGHGSWLVGPALLRALRGEHVRAATLFTETRPETLAELFPRAVPIEGTGRLWRLANGARPVFVRSVDGAIEPVLARMPFGVLALAFDCATGVWCDPGGGLDDVRAGRLRALGEPAEATRRDPLLLLRAATLVAEHGLVCETGEARALEAGIEALDGVPPAHVAALLRAIVLAPGAVAGLELLDAAGLRPAWLGGAPTVDPASIGELPRDLALRLLAWCRPHPVARLLRRLRLDVGTREQIVRLAEHHPLDERLPSPRPRSLRRLLDRITDDGFEGLVALRRCELRAAQDPGAAARLDAVAAARESLVGSNEGRIDLAVGGRDLIDALSIAPGPAIGRLLARLESDVASGAVANDHDALLERARSIEIDVH